MVTKTKKYPVTPAPNSNEIIDKNFVNLNQGDQNKKGITQKKAFEILIPNLFVLRKKGCSWKQITNLLNEKCGFNLKITAVRSYFSEMVHTQSDICQKKMAEHIIEMNDINKNQENISEKAEIFRMAVAAMNKRQSVAESKIAEIFDMSSPKYNETDGINEIN